MKTLEEAFSESEQSAEAVQKSAGKVVSLARAMSRAAKTGNIALIKRSQDNLGETLSVLEQDISNAASSWPLSEEEEKQIMEEQFAKDLIQCASELGLNIYEQDGALISYPSIVRILTADRSVRVDRKKVSTIRLTFLVDLLVKNQKRSSGIASPRFLEALYGVYSDISGGKSRDLLSNLRGPVVPLARIYKLLTSLPGVSRDYDRSDFSRDLYTLEIEGPHQTRKGSKVSFPSSTGTRRRSSDVFSIIGPDGSRVEYYGIQFTESD